MPNRRITDLLKSTAPYGREIILVACICSGAYLADSIVKEIGRSLVMLELARQKCEATSPHKITRSSKL